MKKRILFSGEASFLSTGFAAFQREILKRLHKTGKYELAEFGAWASPGDPRGKSLPWKFYGNLPANEQEKKVYESEQVNQFGKYKIDSVLADFQPDVVFDCVPPGELIATENGYKPIEKIQKNDRVLTHKGRFRKVNSSWSRPYNGNLISINVGGNREPLRVTENHPVLVFRNRRQTNRKKSWSKIYEDIEPEFVKASEICPGDLVTLPQIKTKKENLYIYLQNFVDKFYLRGDKIRPEVKGKFVNSKIEINEDFARLIGYYLGDGYANGSSVTFTFHEDEVEFISDVINLIEKIFGIEAFSRLDKNKRSNTVYVHSVILSKFFKSYLKDLHIPKEIYISSNAVKMAVITGLVRSDGCYKRRIVSFANTKRHLIYEYRLLCASIGIPTNITFTGRKKYKTLYEVSTFGNKSENVVKFTNKYDFDLQNPVLTKSSKQARVTQIINGFLVSSVRSVAKEKYNGPVFNFEVDEDNSYCVNSFCTHNCRDPWMLAHVVNARFRSNFKLILTPTVDSAPQKREWLELFKKADVLTTYSRYGKRVLEKAGLIVTDVTSPGICLDTFKSLENTEIRDAFQLQKSLLIFGTVMRNQKRKLFPDLFDAYRQLRDKWIKAKVVKRAKDKFRKGKSLSKDEKNALRIDHSVLYCHTSWPDLGWDLPDYLQRYNLQRHVIFTYKCESCKEVFPDWFAPCNQEGMRVCRICGEHAAHMPSTHSGVDESKLIEIFNLFDIYIQPAICEGWGLPIMESKACGIPGIYQNYSAMEDHVENGGGFPIKIARLYHEAETGSVRSLPDVGDLVRNMEKFAFNDKLRLNKGREARKCAERIHSWDLTATKFEKIIDNLDILDRAKTWNKPPKFKDVCGSRSPDGLSNKDFIVWLYINVLKRAPDQKGFNDWIMNLEKGAKREQIEGYFRQQVAAHNNFEKARWANSMKLRGLKAPREKPEEHGDVMPGILV